MTCPRSLYGRGLALAALTLAACGRDETSTATSAPAPPPAGYTIDPGDGGDYRPAFDPAEVVDAITNPYMPLTPGSRWIYESTDGDGTERIEVTVTDERRTILGVSAVVVRDTVTLDGELVEDTWDWYAQDRQGNVWYLGEETAEYEDGEVVSTAGAWEAGIDGALPGVIMEAAPAVGDAYRQEFLAGEAEDMAEVINTGAAERVADRVVGDLLVIREWTPLLADTVEDKYYAPGVGLVVEQAVAGGEGRIELIEFTPGA